MKFEKHIVVNSSPEPENPVKITDLIAAEVELSKPAIKQAMNKGAVWLSSGQSTRRVRRAAKTASPGETIHLYYDESILEQTPAPAKLISDEEDYSIWYKPYGMLCQGSKWGDQCTINRWVETHHQPQKSAFIVHRLDRAASGLIILAHKKKTAAYFSKLFQQRNIEKRYQAIVLGKFPEALVFDSDIDGKSARTEVVSIKYDLESNCSLLSVDIKTGRKHQIRRHLSGAGFPIVGDRMYGSVEQDDLKNLALRSCFLSFLCPKQQVFRAFALPKCFELTLA